jgi:hypothetical protein
MIAPTQWFYPDIAGNDPVYDYVHFLAENRKGIS